MDIIDLPIKEKTAQISARIPESLKSAATQITKDRNLSLSDLIEAGLKNVVKSVEMEEILSIADIIYNIDKNKRLDTTQLDSIINKHNLRGWCSYLEDFQEEPLVIAARKDNKKLFQYLLDNNIYNSYSTNRLGEDAFFLIAQFNLPFARVLLEEPYKFNINTVDRDGNSVMHKIMREYKFCHKRKNSDYSLLIKKKKTDTLGILKELMSLDIDPTIQNYKGETALHLLTYGKGDDERIPIDLEILQLFINSGYDFTIKDHNQRAFSDYENGKELLTLLNKE